jgi:hypothetical protein
MVDSTLTFTNGVGIEGQLWNTRQGGECTMLGNTVYLPDWLQNTCAERDAGLLLLLEWELYWSSNSMEACCDQYFEYDGKCGLV